REGRLAQHLHRHRTRVPGQVELYRLGRPREVVDAEEDVLLPRADVREDARIVAAERLVRAEPEDGMLLPQGDEPLQPAEERARRPELRLDVDGLEAVDRIHERLEVELRPVGAREA